MFILFIKYFTAIYYLSYIFILIMIKGLDWVSDYAWECMTEILASTFLKDLQQSPELQIEFSTDPWLFYLFTNLKSFSEKCLEFLSFWLTHFVFS